MELTQAALLSEIFKTIDSKCLDDFLSLFTNPARPFWTESYAISSDIQGTFTGISNDLENIARTFTLEQNYPNPFTGSTVVIFSLPLS